MDHDAIIGMANDLAFYAGRHRHRLATDADLEAAWQRLLALRWQSMDSAPRDGKPVYVQRVYNGEVIKQGWAVWGVNSPDAPMRHGDEADADYADTPRWLTLDRRFSFPTPTAWMPLPPVKD